jgi:hypothetical protein
MTVKLCQKIERKKETEKKISKKNKGSSDLSFGALLAKLFGLLSIQIYPFLAYLSAKVSHVLSIFSILLLNFSRRLRPPPSSIRMHFHL